jgi:selenocysteine-specific translation elongation factor
MKPEEIPLRDLLSVEAERERRAYRRATFLVAITALAGLIWFGFSAYKVVQLERDSSRLKEEIQQRTRELTDVRQSIVVAKDELENTNRELEDTSGRLKDARKSLSAAERSLETIARGTESSRRQAQNALASLPVSLESPSLMAVEDVFFVQGRGVVAVGRVERGKIKVNDSVEIVGIRPTKQAVVTSLESFKKLLDEAAAGDNVGLWLRGVEKREMQRGQVIAKPGSIFPYTRFQARIDMFQTERGGRDTPVTTGYRPQCYFRTTDVTCEVKLLRGTEIMPGDKNVEVEIQLAEPIAMERGLRFAIREAGKSVGTGIVAGLIE